MKKAIESEHSTRMPFNTLRSAVGIVFNDAGQVLLGLCTLKDKRENKFCFPGGGIEKNENLYQAAKREVKEETGISTKALPLSPIVDSDLKSVTFVVLKRTGGSIKPNEEFSDVDFFSLTSLPKEMFGQNKKMLTVVKKLVAEATNSFDLLSSSDSSQTIKKGFI
jgi:8-oxo-dGTP pyrophosphatase MutT (NUDIX family)